MSDPSIARAEEPDINIESDADAVTRLVRLLRTFPEELSDRDRGTASAYRQFERLDPSQEKITAGN